MLNQPYIGFEGPIGAGKTTLAQLLAAHLGAILILEDVDGNEFLSDFYGDKQRWSLGMQPAFLVSRHQQLAGVARSPRPRSVVADYIYAKDGIFARKLLQGRELSLYSRISSGLRSNVAQPDLVIYLDADNDVLLERIKRRKRDYQKSIDREYLESVRDSYAKYFSSDLDVRFIRFDTSALNLASESELGTLYRTITAAYSGGVAVK